MGAFVSSCCGSSEQETEYLTPDPETRRRQVAEAAERRAQETQSKGIKDPERVKRMQQKSEELERREREAGYQQANLKVVASVTCLFEMPPRCFHGPQCKCGFAD